MKKVCRLFEKVSLVLMLLVFAACSNFVQDIRVSVNETETTFFVEHWKQTVDGSSYEQDKKAAQVLNGISMSKTKVKALDYEGFTSQKIDQQTINRDGSTVVKVYYDRNTITYTFKPAGGNWNGNTKDIKVSGLYGAAVQAPQNPEKIGYTFCEWDARVPSVFGAASLSFTSLWAPGTGTPYKVEHWFQTVSGDGYEIDDAETESKVGTTEAQTNAQAKYCDGFTGQTIEQAQIVPDGSTVVKVYYDRNTITYTFNPAGGHWGNNTSNLIVSGLYGAVVNEPADPEKQGYVFNAWDESIPQTFGAVDLVFTSKWNPGIDTPYTVQHWFQNVSASEYIIDSAKTEEKTGTTDAATLVEANEYPGFTAQEVEQSYIAPDGSTIIRVYYDRNTITYTFKCADGKWNGNTADKVVTGLYGAVVNKPVEPTANHSAYLFDRWNSTIPDCFGTEDKTFTAQYKYNLYETVTILPAGTDGTAGNTWTYVYFGLWPQTIKDESVTIDKSKYLNYDNGNKWYYLGSDGYYYYDNRQGNYYRLEPIKWRVLTTNYNQTGNALLFAERILFGSKYSTNSYNQYLSSYIRNFLNVNFQFSAFTNVAQKKIQLTRVDNSPKSTNPYGNPNYLNDGVNKYSTDCTNDKIFLLSQEELSNPNYGFDDFTKSDSARIRISTDYAISTGVTSAGAGWWWMRSPQFNSFYMARAVTNLGICLDGCRDMSRIGGIVPALTISLSN